MITSNRTWLVETKDIDIQELVPQREPVLMVDSLLFAEDDRAETCFLVRPGNYFLDEEGLLAETGVLEHMAQSASALAGWRERQAGASTPPVGFIGEVKKFSCYRRPAVGEELHTTVTLRTEFEGILVVALMTEAGGVPVAGTQMKVSMKV